MALSDVHEQRPRPNYVEGDELVINPTAFAIAVRAEVVLACTAEPYNHGFVMAASRALRRARHSLTAIRGAEDVLEAVGQPFLPNDEGWAYRLPGYGNDRPAA